MVYNITTTPHHRITADRRGDALGIAQNPTFSRAKCLPVAMWGTLSARRVWPSFVCAQTRPTRKVDFRGANRTVMAATGLSLQSCMTQFFCDLQGGDCRSQWSELLRLGDS